MDATNNNNNPAVMADDQHTEVVDGQSVLTFEVPATISKPSYTNEDKMNVHRALTGEYITGTAKMYTMFPLPYQQASAIGCLACLLAGVDHKKCLMTPNSYHKHLARKQPNAPPGAPSIGCQHMPMFNDFLQECLLSNQLEGRAGTKFLFPCDTQTIIVDLIQEQDDCHVFASLQADIIKKQEELKAAIARLTAFTGTLVNSNDAPAVVPTAAILPIIIPAAAVGNVAPAAAAVGNVAPVAAAGIVAARKSKRAVVKKIRMNL